MQETDELQAARKAIKALKTALADAHLDWLLERSCLDIAYSAAGDNGGGVTKKERCLPCGQAKTKGTGMKRNVTVQALWGKVDMTRQH